MSKTDQPPFLSSKSLAPTLRAALQPYSPEAEVSELVNGVAEPGGHLRMGDALCQMNRGHGLINEDVSALEDLLDRSPAEPIRFE
ncbi:hypothetical protein [Herbaspirillum huttiense]|uniref:hypothetical protein n=1 Tax=Herbaspirillum huttiense TaxID=863372 RepID=UPI0005850DD1|nr:hypothetical protein [Herbaspirillum huttiense]